MKVDFSENKWGTNIDLRPDDVSEFAALLRTIQNSKAEKADTVLRFHEDGRIELSIYFKKVDPMKQRNFISKNKY